MRIGLRGAERNLEEQLEYIGERNPPAADRLADKIATTSRASHTTRELVVPRTPYIVVYTVESDYVRIHRVLHGAQRWPPRR